MKLIKEWSDPKGSTQLVYRNGKAVYVDLLTHYGIYKVTKPEGREIMQAARDGLGLPTLNRHIRSDKVAHSARHETPRKIKTTAKKTRANRQSRRKAS